MLLFVLTLLPYFTVWMAQNFYSLPAQTMYGLTCLLLNIIYIISVKSVFISDPYNKRLQESNFLSKIVFVPLLIIIVGFIISYTIYVIIVVLNMVIKYLLLDIDRGNIALQLESGTTDEKIILLIVLCGFIIGYLAWPQAIIFACFLSMFVSFINRHFLKIY